MTPPASVRRRRLLDRVADLVPPTAGEDCVRVAVDGVDGSGKTVFADELAAVLSRRGRPVLSIHADDFLNPQAVRHRRGRDSPEGFWLDSYDYPALRARVLDPLGPGGDRRYQPACHDLASDSPVSPAWRRAEPGSVVVLDGLFLHRDELVAGWDFSVFLDVPFEISVGRMAERDGTAPDPAHPSMTRYVQGQLRYFTACDPRSRASIVIDNSDPQHPQM